VSPSRFKALPKNGFGSFIGCLRHQLHIIDEAVLKAMGLDLINCMYCSSLVIRWGENFLTMVLYVAVWVSENLVIEDQPTRAPTATEKAVNRRFVELVYSISIEEDAKTKQCPSDYKKVAKPQIRSFCMRSTCILMRAWGP